MCTQIEILLREYLDCEYQSFTSEDIDRLSDTDGSLSKTAKQLIEVAKQFGSLGRSVSKRLWSNMTSKRPKSPPSSGGGISTEGLLCVRIKSRRHQYVDQMLQNYLQCAHARYRRNFPRSYLFALLGSEPLKRSRCVCVSQIPAGSSSGRYGKRTELRRRKVEILRCQ